MAATTGCFDPRGDIFVLSSPDGRIRFWEVATGRLKQEYTPTSHLSSGPSALCWCNIRQLSAHATTRRKRGKKLKLEEPELTNECSFIAIGTLTGSVTLYDVTRGISRTEFSSVHSDEITCVIFNQSHNRLFTSSKDSYIVEWDWSTGRAKSKWQADRSSVTAVTVSDDATTLITAGRSIKLWNPDTQKLLKKFVGHATSVSTLKFLSLQTTEGHHHGDRYFLSTADNDRHINVWRVSEEARCKNALVSFLLPEEPVVVDVTNRESQLHLAAVTRSGMLYVFTHRLNGGGLKQPIKPSRIIQVVTKETPILPIPILHVNFTIDPDQSLTAVYGSILKPAFENVALNNNTELTICLIRQDPSIAPITTQVSDDKVKTVSTNNDDVTLLLPGHMVPIQQPSLVGSSNQSESRKRKEADDIGTRMSSLTLATAARGGAKAGHLPTTDSMSILLSQGLQSEDSDLLNKVFNVSNDHLIQNTVKNLSTTLVPSLVKVLTLRLHSHPQGGIISIKWLKAVLSNHTSQLINQSELLTSLNRLYELMNCRIHSYTKLSKLGGKLELLVSQLGHRTGAGAGVGAIGGPAAEGGQEVDDTPLQVFRGDNSSDESLDEIIYSQTESDNDWGDFESMCSSEDLKSDAEMSSNGEG